MIFDAFMLKKIVSMLAHVIPGVPLLMLLALILLNWLPRFSSRCLWVCTALLLLFSSPFVSNSLVGSLEKRFPPLQSAAEDTRLILVLGSGHQYRPGRSNNSVLSAISLSRMTEGIRLWNSNTDSILITSGAQSYSSTSNAEVSASLAIEQGVPEAQIRKLDQARDTEEEIRMAVELLAKESGFSNPRLIIVSSATHLARAKQLIAPYNVTYSMAPTDYLATDMPWFRLSAGNLHSADRALHEYVGMLWHWIRS